MRTITLAVLGVALVGLAGLTPATARADCAEDIAKLEDQLAESASNTKAKKVANMIAKSKAALAEKKKKKCEKIMAKAVAAFEEGEAAAASGGGKSAKAGGGQGGGKGGGKASTEACAAKVKDLEDRMAPVPLMHGRRSSVEAFIYNAKVAAEKGQKKKCETLANRADKTLKAMGY